MTPILEGLRTGAWRLVPVEMTAEMATAYRLARMNIAGGYGGPGPWEAALSASPDATAALLAEIEGLRGAVEPRCEHCDGTGDVHTADGEWRGSCSCPAAELIEAARKDAAALAERAGIDMMDDHNLFLNDLTETLLRFRARATKDRPDV